MRILSTVVPPLVLAVLDTRHHFSSRRAVALQLVCYDHTRDIPQIKDVKVGQPVAVDTRNGIIQGQVSRIDPAAREGTFVVDAELTGPLLRQDPIFDDFTDLTAPDTKPWSTVNHDGGASV